MAQTTGQATTYDGQGNILAGVVITFQQIAKEGSAGQSNNTAPFTATSVGTSANNLSVTLEQNATYQAWRGPGGKIITFQTGSASTYQLPPIPGNP
jgi:hypothetical protein